MNYLQKKLVAIDSVVITPHDTSEWMLNYKPIKALTKAAFRMNIERLSG